MTSIYLLAPMIVWMLAGMASTLNIGYRHVLPIVAPACCLIGAATVALWQRQGRWYRAVLAGLLLMHAGSSLISFPNQMAYANEAFGGTRNSYKLLTDSNNDWSQALPQIAAWLREQGVPRENCWLAYDGLASPSHSGVNCRALLPNGFGTAGPAPPATVTGTFIIGNLTLSGIEWERPDLNPYAVFRETRPLTVIGGADVVYRGTYDLSRLLAVHDTVQAMTDSAAKQYAEALPLASFAVLTLPSSGFAHLQMANALKGLGRNGEAYGEYRRAQQIADAQPEWYFLQRPKIEKGVRDTAPR